MPLVRVLGGQPSLLILDEPTASLSAPEAERPFALLDALRGDGMAILLVSHRLGDLRRIADRVAIVGDGRIVADLPAPVDFDAAVEAMIGPPLPKTREPAPARTASHEPDAASGMRCIRLTPASTPSDLDVRRGEIVAIAGPADGGKSHFANMIFGAARAVAGPESRVMGGRRVVDGPSCAPAARAAIFIAAADKRIGIASLTPSGTRS